MKAALVKQKRFKEVPRYNPAAERVRQRASWMEQVIAEEQNKPLELAADRYSNLLKQEAEERTKFAHKTKERFDKVKELKKDLEDKEMRKLQYRRFLAEQEKQRRAAMAKEGSLDALYGLEPEAQDSEVGMSVDAIVNLQKLERLEERMGRLEDLPEGATVQQRKDRIKNLHLTVKREKTALAAQQRAASDGIDESK